MKKLKAYRIFIQARMSSQRFPGKVLAPFWGKPVLGHIVERLAEVSGHASLVVLTSRGSSDDPIAAYVRSLGLSLFRGELVDVAGRFCEAFEEFPCEWAIRVTADSPLVSPALLRFLLEVVATTRAEFVTTTYHRTLPKGANLEAFRAEHLVALWKGRSLHGEEREHVTLRFHRHPPGGRIASIELANEDFSDEQWAVDEVNDLREIERRAENYFAKVPWEQLRVLEVSL